MENLLNIEDNVNENRTNQKQHICKKSCITFYQFYSCNKSMEMRDADFSNTMKVRSLSYLGIYM